MKIVITGGAGFIGSSFANLCLEKGHDVLVVDKITYAGSLKNLNIDHDNLRLELEDINNVTEESLGEFDYLVNFAAESHVDNSIDDGTPFIQSNIVGTFNLLEIARRNKKLKKFIQISTDEVYGDLKDLKLKVAKETTAVNPSSYYSASKTAADHLVAACGRTYNLPYLITRTCNNFGEKQFKEKFIPKIIDCIKNDLEVPVYGDGQQSREWIWVEDNAAKLYEVMLDDTSGIINIGSDEAHKNIDIINYIGKELKKDIKYKFVEDRKGHDKLYRITTERGYPPTITKTLFQFLKEQL